MNLTKLDIEDIKKALPEISSPLPNPKEPDKKKKKKGIWDKMWGKRKLKKPNIVAVMFLRNNGMAEPLEIQSKQGFFNIYGKTYHENRDCIWSLTKERVPFAIIPEWSLIPIGTQRWENKDMMEKFAELQDHTLRGIRHAELVRMGDEKGKMNLNAKTVIGIIIVAIIGLAILANYF